MILIMDILIYAFNTRNNTLMRKPSEIYLRYMLNDTLFNLL